MHVLFLAAIVVVLAGLLWFGLRAGERRVATSPEQPRAFVLDPLRWVPLLVAGVIALLIAVL